MKRLYTLIRRAWKAAFNKPPLEKLEFEGEVGFTSSLIAHKLPKDLEINVHDDVSVQDQYPLGIHRHGGQEESVRIASGLDKMIWADVDSSGEVSFSIEGKSPPGESGTYLVCSILIEKINDECEASWGDLVDLSASEEHREEGVDCRACDGENTLDIQVTRVETRIWKELAELGKVSGKSWVEAIADEILRVIEKKSKPIPAHERAKLVLALNALETPGIAFRQVVSTFHSKYGPKAKSLGYKSIWLVGRTTSLTSQLDR